MISEKHKCIYIEIPSATNVNLNLELDSHQATIPARYFFARRIKAELGEVAWKDYFKFAFVRNPWDRAVSLFFQQTKHEIYRKDMFRKWLTDQVTENRWPADQSLDWECSMDNHKSTGGTSVPWKCQTDWLIDEDGKLSIDFLGRWENLQKDWDMICSIAGIPPKFLSNKSDWHHYSWYYDDELQAVVHDWHKRDIENFDYEFEREETPASLAVV